MANYRVLLTDLLTGAPLEELPVKSLTWTSQLNAPGSITAIVSIAQPPQNLIALQALLPVNLGKLGIVVERDGVILWGGIPWTWQPNWSDGTATLSGEGWHSYVRRRILRRNLTFTGQDQTSVIAAALINATQSPGLTPVIDTSHIAPSQVFRDRTYSEADRSSIGQLIEDLAAVISGFDFRYDTVRTNDVISANFVTMYPNTGRQTPTVFEVSRDIADGGIAVDATALATHVDEIGAGEGDTGIRVTVANAALIGVYPLLDVVESRTDVTQRSTLDGYARQRLSRGQTPITLPSITVDPNLEPIIGSYVEGDIVRVRGGFGLANIDSLCRIAQIQGSLTETGERVALTFSGVGAFQPT